MLSNEFATCAHIIYLEKLLLKDLGVDQNVDDLKAAGNYRINDMIGPLVILGLVYIQPPHGELTDDYYYLTELGKKVALNL